MKNHKKSKLVILFVVSYISVMTGEVLSRSGLMFNKYVNMTLSLVIPLICLLLYIHERCKGDVLKTIIYSVLIMLIIPLVLYYIIFLCFI